MEREIVAILIDGDFYLRRAKYLWGENHQKNVLRNSLHTASAISKSIRAMLKFTTTYIEFSFMIVLHLIKTFIIHY